jgi:hypothetical protein
MIKIIADKVPAAEACVCTILFSRMLESFAILRTAIEITAAGIAEENVKPTFSPR